MGRYGLVFPCRRETSAAADTAFLMPPPDGGGLLNWVRSGIVVGGVALSSISRGQDFSPQDFPLQDFRLQDFRLQDFRLQDPGLTAQAAAALGVVNGPSAETGLPIGPFLAYPQLTIGGVYNDNLYPAATRRQAAVGLRAAPSVTALDDEGLHRTSLYFNAEAELYPGADVPAAMKTPINLFAGVSESWAPTPGLGFDARASFSRQNSLAQAAATGTGFVAGPSVLNLTPANPFLDHTEADLTLQRDLGDGFFVRAGGRVEDLVYENAPSGGNYGGRSYAASLRAGYALTPTLTGFLEADANFQRRANAAFGADVESLSAGLSSDLISLFRGEIHAGWQRQTSPGGRFAATAAPTYGASLTYYPTPYLTLTLGLDRSFAFTAAAPVTAAGAPAASPGVWQARLSADYALAAYWRASASTSWLRSSTAGAGQTAWGAGATFSYTFWRNLDLTLADQFSRFGGSGGIRGYDQNVTSLGVTYKY